MSKKTAYVNGIILDGTKDMFPVSGKTIIVENKKIKSIVNAEDADLSDCKVVDLAGKYIIPGLINLHAHLPGSGKPSKKPIKLEPICKVIRSNHLGRAVGKGMIASSMKSALMSGVTTIRAVGGIGNLDSLVRDDIKKGKLVGPRILSADCAISVKGGHMANTFAYVASSAEQAGQLVDKISKNKPDLIKLMVTGGVMDTNELGMPGALLMPPEYIKTACEKAHAHGYKVAAHAEGYEGVIACLENGVDTIEHGAMPDDKMIELFKKTGAAHTLTISPALPYANSFDNMFNLSEAATKNSIIVMEGMIALAKSCLDNGIPVGLGTDSSSTYVTQYDFWREMYYFVKFCGVSRSFALHTATQINAQIAGIGDITGSIEEGKMADMVVVDGNPLENLSVLKKPAMVVFEGHLYDSPSVKNIPVVDEILDKHFSTL